jgi:hypothetical protein
MATNISDRNGRALEYAITTELQSAGYSAVLTTRAVNDNVRDFPKYQAMPATLQKQYKQASVKIAHWVNGQIGNQKTVIDRLPDLANSVTDITIKSVSQTIELSVKHNHQALKHPRPYSLAQFCGYAKNSPQDVAHRAKLNSIALGFRVSVNGTSKFNLCAPTQITKLYDDVNIACKSSIDAWALVDKSLPQSLFDFLVNTGFYKVIVDTRQTIGVTVTIQDYFSIAKVSSVTTTTAGNRLIFRFNNNWEINCRLHTASSSISLAPQQLSLKFDAQRTAGVINQNTL